jgi:hypothetical protein
MMFMHQCEIWARLPYIDHDYPWCSTWLNAFFLGSGLHTFMCNLAKYPRGYGGCCHGGLFMVDFSLFSITYVRYLMVFWCIDFMRFLVVILVAWSFLSLSIECSWMKPWTPIMIVTSGFTFHPWYFRRFISGSYLICLILMVVFM